MLDAALAYGDLGWPVLPLHSPVGGGCSCGRADCGSPAKHPRTAHGLDDATTDPTTIMAWWARRPTANVGLRTGVAFDVCDIDGPEGLDALNIARAGVGITWGPEARTGGGGWHLLFEPTGAGNRAAMVPKVDWRGRGGYIVAPPSLHISGRRYEWAEEIGAGRDEPLEPLEPPPNWLRELVLPPPVPPTILRRLVVLPGGRYARAALAGEVEELRRAAVGDRNHSLNRAAFRVGQLVGAGVLDAPTAAAGLLAVALDIGLGEKESRDTIVSGLNGGAAKPRQGVSA